MAASREANSYRLSAVAMPRNDLNSLYLRAFRSESRTPNRRRGSHAGSPPGICVDALDRPVRRMQGWTFKKAGLAAALVVFLVLGAGYLAVAYVAASHGYEAPAPPPQ